MKLPNLACLAISIMLRFGSASAQGLNILDYATPGTQVDRAGKVDASVALAAAIAAANAVTAVGGSACVYIPAGTYRITRNPPEFARAGCIKGEGPTQSTIQLDSAFSGDLFTWSEAWVPTTPGPTVVGLRIIGSPGATHQQNALVFYDRNDEVFLDQVEVDDLPGRALYSGTTLHTPQAYMRESHLRSLRFFRDGAPGVPAVEFSSAGTGAIDATNEVRISQLDIYGARGPGLVIRNSGQGVVRAITAESLRIEGGEQGGGGDLLTIGDTEMTGLVTNITLTNLELIDVPAGFAGLRVTAAENATVPYLIEAYGFIGGGASKGDGLRIDAGRASAFHLNEIATGGRSVVVGKRAAQIVIDGSGAEACWTYQIDPTIQSEIITPSYVPLLAAVARGSGASPVAAGRHC